MAEVENAIKELVNKGLLKGRTEKGTPIEIPSKLACSECYDWPLSSMLPKVLDSFDLPECYAQLGGKLKLVDPAGAMLSDLK